jgi:hypothetical protein
MRRTVEGALPGFERIVDFYTLFFEGNRSLLIRSM